MSPKLAAFTYLRSAGIIQRASEARYVGCFGADHIFGIASGDIVAVDLVLRSHRVGGVAA